MADPHARPLTTPPMPRTTLASSVDLTGVGLFTGKACTLTLAPLHASAAPLTSAVSRGGIHFVHWSSGGACTLCPATAAFLIPERRRTVLGPGQDQAAAIVLTGDQLAAVSPQLARSGPRPGSPQAQTPDSRPAVQTVEHLLSALAGMGVTDALCVMDGPEIPIGDGSAAPFVEMIRRAGTCPARTDPTNAPSTAFVTGLLRVQEGDGVIEAYPSAEPGLSLTYELDYGAGAPIPPQTASLHWTPGTGVAGYAEQIATARTFCLLEEAVAMRKMGLFTSFEPSDLLVIGPSGPIDNAYRFPNEPARHKLLDLLGDLVLAGRPPQARIVARRAGHALNHQMARALASLP